MSFSLLSSVVMTGILNGGLYALLGLAIVLILRTTGVANFAQGEMASLGVFLLVIFVLPLGLPLWLAVVATLALSALIGIVVFAILIQPRPNAGHLNLTVRTLGLYTLIAASSTYLWGADEPYRVPSLFGRGQFAALDLAIGYDQLGALTALVLLAAAYLAFFRWTDAGLAMRAVAMNREVAGLLGINVRRVAVMAWAIAATIGTAVGLLIAPITFLQTSLMQPILFKAFTAVIIGGVHSAPGVIMGGVILGVAEAIAASAISIQMREPFVFIVLLTVLLLRPSGILGPRHLERV